MAQLTELESAIVVVLDARPQIHVVSKGVASFDLSGDHYEDVGLGSHNGFYDFLRSPSGAILGIRYLPSPDAEGVLAGLSEGSGLRFANDGELRVLLIFWTQEQGFDPETSSDQYFGDNAVYRGRDSGKLAIAFSIDLLSAPERASFVT